MHVHTCVHAVCAQLVSGFLQCIHCGVITLNVSVSILNVSVSICMHAQVYSMDAHVLCIEIESTYALQ
jgi:hypothetical protein